MKIVFFSGVGYNSCIGGRTVQLAKEFSKRHEVHFVEIPSLRRWNIGTRKIDNVFVHTLFPRADRMLVRFNLSRLEHKIGLADSCIIVSHPIWQKFLSNVKCRKFCYDCLDHVSIHAGSKHDFRRVNHKQNHLLSRADCIFAISQKLYDSIRMKKKCFLVKNAAPEYFLDLPVSERKSPVVIGFHGALYEWIDYSLLEEIARQFPDCTLRLVGDVRNPYRIRNLKKMKNVEILPAFHFDDLPKIISGFTIGIIPFLDNKVASFSDPLKGYETLALGREVVSTVKADLSPDVYHYSDRKNFCEVLRTTLDSPKAPWKCRQSVSENSWTDRCNAIIDILQNGRKN